MKAIAVIGYHHTGKTSTVVNLVRELCSRGHTVATIKDIHSEKFRADTPGKNSALHIKAGSKLTVARGIYDTALIFPRSLPLNEIMPHIAADFLVIEGMKAAPMAKIVCADSEAQLTELIDDTCIGISDIITNSDFKHDKLDVFRIPQDVSALCDTVLAHSFEILPAADPECCQRCGGTCLQMAGDIVQGRRKRSECVLDGTSRISLKVGGKDVLIVPFVQDILKDSIMAIVNNLRDIAPNQEIQINIRT
ncbi:MAG: molybdopterin-guanine dinucleotide biosynthesis protein B [Candidatus Cloacimonetes bacterium]|jgi:molybdopterin-guanine dinucleotide biosynthesis protein B|nr:molybdopterin-guanine dinucleotide biosynthesis protein B [Candidatus Cloacimonadota bacterium]MDD4147236.1 molybdopterin-guanine dinucleotide biosynthesis protein B [Candidatus Cloacimonadota bacterium]MDD4560302.1 molybdopterin-guanine dinucleotide biosynthesis protein B [Candidatus Cloacimonadota bacterium]